MASWLVAPNKLEMPHTETQVVNLQGALLDAPGNLRGLGVGKSLDLPQIIVCGDPSPGKGSVLATISGFPFPVSDGLCTRFPTQLALRQKESSFQASIRPGPTRTADEKAKLERFRVDYVDLAAVESVYEQAKLAIGIDDNSSFTDDTLCLELGELHLLNLTLVHPPGFFHSSGIGQTVADADFVQKMVLAYIKQPWTVVLRRRVRRGPNWPTRSSLGTPARPIRTGSARSDY
ncbi:hypothetical protein CLAIMM_14328 [Cladophialophora immunda]|nr:hypothetical protein CLAIMM_14328 [Cladophialophora immunda]